MSTTTISTEPSRTHASDGEHLTFGHIVASEWIKLRSVRSTVWSYSLVVVGSFGLAALMGLSARFDPVGSFSSADQAKLLVQGATFGVFFSQLIVAVLGVLVISGEYSTGMVRSTLTAVPKRIPALGAKAIVLFVTTYVVGLISTVGSFFVISPMMAGQGVHASLIDPDVLLPILAASLYLALVSVFALGLGTIVRSSAAGVAAALGAILLLPIAMLMIPAEWAHDTIPYLIMNAGLGSFGLNAFGPSGTLEPWQQILVVIGWALVTMILGAVLLKRRDA